jgi:hypothetical protein
MEASRPYPIYSAHTIAYILVTIMKAFFIAVTRLFPKMLSKTFMQIYKYI